MCIVILYDLLRLKPATGPQVILPSFRSTRHPFFLRAPFLYPPAQVDVRFRFPSAIVRCRFCQRTLNKTGNNNIKVSRAHRECFVRKSIGQTDRYLFNEHVQAKLYNIALVSNDCFVHNVVDKKKQ